MRICFIYNVKIFCVCVLCSAIAVFASKSFAEYSLECDSEYLEHSSGIVKPLDLCGVYYRELGNSEVESTIRYLILSENSDYLHYSPKTISKGFVKGKGFIYGPGREYNKSLSKPEYGYPFLNKKYTFERDPLLFKGQWFLQGADVIFEKKEREIRLSAKALRRSVIPEEQVTVASGKSFVRDDELYSPRLSKVQMNVVLWGERIYLLPSFQLVDFCEAVIMKIEPRTQRAGSFFLKTAQINTVPQGKPVIDHVAARQLNRLLEIGASGKNSDVKAYLKAMFLRYTSINSKNSSLARQYQIFFEDYIYDCNISSSVLGAIEKRRLEVLP